MFAKGPMPGATPRSDFLARYPGATCKKEHLAYGMVGFTVYLADGTLVITRGNPKQAWEEALSKLLRREYDDQCKIAHGVSDAHESKRGNGPVD
ncbi:hypothetical protein AS149_37180 [Burkholderia cenocepacia]|nr:hypothetical protein AS149_37180 [Burkholderia cenocepacia]